MEQALNNGVPRMAQSNYKFEKVCLVDDDDIYQYLMKKELKSTELVKTIQVFPNGEKAMEFFNAMHDKPENLPDIIFLDLNMPMMSGWEFLDEYLLLRPRLSKEITILLITSSLDDLDMERAKKYAEVSDYIVKPVTRNRLVNVLKEL